MISVRANSSLCPSSAPLSIESMKISSGSRIQSFNVIATHRFPVIMFFVHHVDQSANNIDEDLDDEDGNNADVVISRESQSGFVTSDCPEPRCVMEFRREDRLKAHLLVGIRKIVDLSCRLLDEAILLYKDGLSRDGPSYVSNLPAQTTSDSATKNGVKNLKEFWGLFHLRTRAPFSIAQRSYLDQKYSEGEKSGTKWDPAPIAEVFSQLSYCAVL